MGLDLKLPVGIPSGAGWIIMKTTKWFPGINPGIQHMKGLYLEATEKGITFILINCIQKNLSAIAHLLTDEELSVNI